MVEPTIEFRKRLAEALSIRNMKQIELSEKTDIPKSAISQYLSGRMIPRHSRIFLLAQTLDVDEAWLMGFNVPMERKTFIEIEESDLANLQMRRDP